MGKEREGKEREGRVPLRALDEGDGGLLVDLNAGVHGGEEGGEVLHGGPLVLGDARRLTVLPATTWIYQKFSRNLKKNIFLQMIF